MKLIKQILVRREIIALFLILFFGLIVRLYKFQNPIADWHAWRQVDTSAVSRFFVKDGFDVFHPRYYDLSNVPSGVHENPQGYRFVEFPFYNLAQALPYKIIGVLTIEEWGRIVTILSSLVSSMLLYLIVKKHLNSRGGLLAAFFFTFIPFNIYFGRTILPDSSTVAAFLATIYFFGRWIDKESSKLNFFISLVFAAVSVLLKPFSLFFLLPMVYLAYEKYGKDFLKNKWLWIFAILSVLPFVFWRIWMLQYPGGIPQSGWLINGSNIMFKGAFFQWIFAQRIGNLILGYWGIPLLILGLLLKLPKKSYLFFLSFLISSLAYLFIIATGNVQHDYYQILIMPSIAIYLALGANFLFENKSNVSKAVSWGILFICIAFMLSFGWYNIRANYIINHPELVRGGKIIDGLIPKDAKVIVPDAIGDTTALYFMDRQGWSSFEKPLPQLIEMGADYMVFFNPKPQDLDFGKTYKLVYSSSDFVLFNLRQKP
ncbi:MAG: glycosyltransferase family 39 protein [Patescibacteria group bacterium]